MSVYLEHFGLREAPFRITPHTEFFFSGAKRGETLEALLYAITSGEGLVKVTGEVGTGKTMLCRVLIERLPETVETVYLAVPSLTRNEILIAIAAELGLTDTTGAATQLLRRLQEKLIALHGEGRRVVALIDEAHAMPEETLEELRLLSNLETPRSKLLQLVLFGQPELDARLAQDHLRQLRERITHSFTLAPLPTKDIGAYVAFRLHAAGYRGPELFGPEVLAPIAEASEGLTRRVNIYADKTLLAAFAAGTRNLTADHARAAIADTRATALVTSGDGKRSRQAAVALGLGGLAAGIALGWAIARWPSPATQAPPPPPPAAPTAEAPAGQPPEGAAGGASAPPGAPQSPVSQPLPAPPPSPPPPLLDLKLEAGAALLRSGPHDAWVVQFMNALPEGREEAAPAFAALAVAIPGGSLYAHRWQQGERSGVSAFLGPYGSREAAEESLASLPEALKRLQPRLRMLGWLRNESSPSRP